jgi:hypothetical protein
MKFTQTGTFKENALEKLVTIKPLESIQTILFDRLDYLIGFVAKEKPEVITAYVRNLIKKCEGLVKADYLDNIPGEIQQVYAQFKHLDQYPDLCRASLNYFIQLLGLSDKHVWELPEVNVTMKALVQAWIYPPYYFLETLAETVGRTDAVKLYKRYITHYHIDHPSPNRDKFVSLEKMLDKRLSGDTTSSEWVIVHTMLQDGKYAFKNKNCPTCADTTQEFPDVEFKYLVCCYGDYEKFRANYGEHIILTMEHTIIEGDAYCSRVLHDTRIDYDLRHPPREFWDNFEPGKEKVAKKYHPK